MAEKGAPEGNNNNRKGTLWNDAIRKVLVQGDYKQLHKAAQKLVDLAEAGEPWAIKELADRLDGKAFQSVQLSSDPENPLEVKHTHTMATEAMSLLSKIRGTEEPAK